MANVKGQGMVQAKDNLAKYHIKAVCLTSTINLAKMLSKEKKLTKKGDGASKGSSGTKTLLGSALPKHRCYT